MSTRLASGGRIDRDRVLRFTFNGRNYQGHPGDTLASALLANGVSLVARSWKYHRPRGILGAGVEEPNALVQLFEGARTVPNARMTEVSLVDGLTATSVHASPSVEFDVKAVNGYIEKVKQLGPNPIDPNTRISPKRLEMPWLDIKPEKKWNEGLEL